MDWEPCSKYCGSGTQKGTKSIKTQPKYGGKACPPPAELTKTQTCNLRACPPVQEITYNIDGYDKWAGEAENEYVCPGVGSNTAKGRCTFYVEDDVKKYCNKDPSCIGYVYKNKVYHPTRKVVNGKGIFIKKNKTIQFELNESKKNDDLRTQTWPIVEEKEKIFRPKEQRENSLRRLIGFYDHYARNAGWYALLYTGVSRKQWEENAKAYREIANYLTQMLNTEIRNNQPARDAYNNAYNYFNSLVQQSREFPERNKKRKQLVITQRAEKNDDLINKIKLRDTAKTEDERNEYNKIISMLENELILLDSEIALLESIYIP